MHAGHAIDPATGRGGRADSSFHHFRTRCGWQLSDGFSYTRSDNPNRVGARAGARRSRGRRGGSGVRFRSGGSQRRSSRRSRRAITSSRRARRITACQVAPRHFRALGLAVDFVDMTDLEAVQKGGSPKTKLIWVETPSNPPLKLTDLAAVAEIAHAAGALCVCDNTWAPIDAATVRSRRGSGHAFDHQIFRRPLRRDRRRVIAQEDDEFFQRSREIQSDRRRGSLTVRLLADPSRDCTRCPGGCARIARTRMQDRALSRRSSEGRAGALSRARLAPAA